MLPDDAQLPALYGVRVVEACEGVGGPMLAMLLAEQGADVIKVEPPQGDRLRGEAAFHVINRSKRSVTVALDSDEGKGALQRLLAEADVFLYDWPPGRDAKRGFDAASLQAADPALIVGYLPAYGSRGPWAHLPPDEALVQALSGASAGQWRYDPRPVYINIPISGYAQGIVGAGAVAAALYARARTGRGDRFELSAVAAIFQFETTAWIRSANVQRLAGQSDPRGPIPTYRLVRASDGWIFIGALTPAFWTKLAVAAGLDDLLIDARFAGAPIAIPNLDDRRELAQRIDAAFATKTRDEWLCVLEDADVPRSLVLSREEWADDAQLNHNGMLIEIDDPVLGRTKQMRVPVRLHSSPGRVRGPAPRLGEHNAAPSFAGAQPAAPVAETPAVASASPVTVGAQPAAPIAQTPTTTKSRTHPLAGIRVLDLGTFIAGASCSMMLADYGADVIKVEGPDGDAWRGSGLGFLGSNRNKRGLCIDLRKPEGRDTFLDLVEQSDVVLDNLRPGIMERLGIGYETLRARNPRIVHCSVTAYGPTGPRAHLPGFDPLMQAQGGIMRAQGESSQADEPVYLQIAVCDYATALTAAYGIIAALFARERTGVGDRVETCLANASLTVQAGEFLSYDGKLPDPPGGRDLAGRHALYRVYQTADGALMLACTTPAHAEALLYAVGAGLAPPASETPNDPSSSPSQPLVGAGLAPPVPETLNDPSSSPSQPPVGAGLAPPVSETLDDPSSSPSQAVVGAGLAPPVSETLHDPASALSHPVEGDLAQQLARAFATHPTTHWLDALLARGVPVAPCVAVADLFEDEHLCANDLWWDTEDPRWGAVRQTGALIKWGGMSMALTRRAPKLGEHSAELLRECGVDPARIDALIAAGVLSQGPPPAT